MSGAMSTKKEKYMEGIKDKPKVVKTQYTPTPWHVGIKQAGTIVYDARGWAICDCKVFHGENGEPKANAAFIVRAVNAYDRDQETIRELVESVKALLESDNIKKCPGGMWSTADSINYAKVRKLEEAISRAKEVRS